MDCICDDILIKTFQYLNQKDRHSVKLTCKRFYGLICEVERNKLFLVINEKTLKNHDNYKSILNSERIIHSMTLDTRQLESLELFWKLKTVCSQKGSEIKNLSWDSANMTTTEIIAILNLMPNVQALKCSYWKIKTEFYDESCESLMLNSLQSLNIQFCDEPTKHFFHKNLQNDKLTKLDVDFYNPDFLSSQQSITYFSMKGDITADKWIELPLKVLKLSSFRNSTMLNEILQYESQLVSLDILSCARIFDRNNDAFVSLCNLKNLRILKINVDDLDHVAFKTNFCKLNKLQELHIENMDRNYSSMVVIIEELSNIRMEDLKKLNLEFKDLGVPADRIESMAMNYPQLLSFQLLCHHPLRLNVYLENFKLLRYLHITYCYDQEFSLICNSLDNCINPNVKTLILEGFNFRSEIDNNEKAFFKMVQSLPNLKVLNAEVKLPLSPTFFTNVFRMLPKLKVFKGLNLTLNKTFDIDYVNYFNKISDDFDALAMELVLIDIGMNMLVVKEMLETKYEFKVTRNASNYVIILKKNNKIVSRNDNAGQFNKLF